MPRTEAFAKDIFLSYAWGPNRERQKFVCMVYEELSKLNLDVWQDMNDLMVGRGLDIQIAKGIVNSEYMVVFITTEYQQKLDDEGSFQNCSFEFDVMLTHHSQKTVFPVVQNPNMHDQKNWGLRLLRLAPLLYHSIAEENQNNAREAARFIFDAIMKEREAGIKSDAGASLLVGLDESKNLARIKDLYYKFIEDTRTWLFNAVKTWASKPFSNSLLISGDKGMGKSVFLAALCGIGEFFNPDKIAQCLDPKAFSNWERDSQHASRRLSLRRLSQKMKGIFSKSASTILVAAAFFVPEEAESHGRTSNKSAKFVLLSIAKQLQKSVQTCCNQITAVSETFTNFSELESVTLDVIFTEFIVKPLGSVKSERNVVVIIDGFDFITEGKDDLQRLLNDWNERLPKWVGLILSSQRQDILSNSLVHLLDPQLPNNYQDVKQVAKIRLEEKYPNTQPLDEWIALTLRKSGGNMGEASNFVTQYDFDTTSLPNQPEDSRSPLEIYESCLRDNFLNENSADGNKRKDFLCALCVAREAIPFDIVKTLLHVAYTEDIQVVIDSSQGILERTRLETVKLGDFERIKSILREDLRPILAKGHALLAEVCQDRVSECLFSAKHAIYHLLEANRLEDLARYLVDYDKIYGAIVQQGVDVTLWNKDLEQYRSVAPKEQSAAITTIDFLVQNTDALIFDSRQLRTQILCRLSKEHPLCTGAEGRHSLSYDELMPVNSTTQGFFLYTLSGKHHDDVTSLAAAANLFISLSEDDEQVNAWNIYTGEKLFHLDIDMIPTCLAMCSSESNGEVAFACAFSGEEGRLIRVYTPTELDQKEFPSRHDMDITCMAMDSKYHQKEFPSRHDMDITSMAMDSKYLVSGSLDGCVTLWDHSSEDHKPRREFDTKKIIIGVALTLKSIFVATEDFQILSWDLHQSDSECCTRVLQDLVSAVCTAFVMYGESLIIVGNEKGEISVWKIEDQSDDTSSKSSNQTASAHRISQEGERLHLGRISSLSIRKFRTKLFLLSGSEDGTVCSWDLTDLEAIKCTGLIKSNSAVTSVTLSPKERSVIGYENGQIRVGRLSMLPLGRDEQDDDNISRHVQPDAAAAPSSCLALAPEYILSGDCKGGIRVWQQSKGEEKAEMCIVDAHKDKITSIVVATDWVATASSDKVLKIWDLNSLAELASRKLTFIATDLCLSEDILLAKTQYGVKRGWHIAQDRKSIEPIDQATVSKCDWKRDRPGKWQVQGGHVQYPETSSFTFDDNISHWTASETSFYGFVAGSSTLSMLKIEKNSSH